MIILLTITVVLNILSASMVYGSSNTAPPSLSSKTAIVIDSETGTVLYEKNSSKKMYPASLTKIATAIYAIEKGNAEEIITVSKKARNIEGTRVYLEEGEEVTLKKLLQGLLINSGNDAGVAIAEHLSGSVEEFSSDINKYLENVIGVQNTNFENPHGLFDPKHVTTAEDLAKITQYAMRNNEFREIFGKKELKWDGESWDTTLYTHHKLMREMPYEGVTGGKTGFVAQAGFTLATTAKKKNIGLIVITLNNNTQLGAYQDTTNLLDYTFDHFQTSRISEGTRFMIDGQEYKSPKDLFYTNLVDDETIKKLKENGTVEIVNQDGSVITSFLLDKVKKAKEEKVTSTSKTSKEKQGTNELFKDDDQSYLTFTIIIVVLGISGICYRQFRKI